MPLDTSRAICHNGGVTTSARIEYGILPRPGDASCDRQRYRAGLLRVEVRDAFCC